jgi:hypothetical protein
VHDFSANSAHDDRSDSRIGLGDSHGSTILTCLPGSKLRARNRDGREAGRTCPIEVSEYHGQRYGPVITKASRASQSDRSERGGCDVKNVDPARKIDAERAAHVKRACGRQSSFRSLRRIAIARA